MAVFHKYEYTNKWKNIHPWPGWDLGLSINPTSLVMMEKYLLNTHAFVLILFIANFSSTYWLRNARLLKLFTLVKITCHFSEAMTRCKDKRPESQVLGLSSPSSASSGALCYFPPAAHRAVLEIFG